MELYQFFITVTSSIEIYFYHLGADDRHLALLLSTMQSHEIKSIPLGSRHMIILGIMRLIELQTSCSNPLHIIRCHKTAAIGWMKLLNHKEPELLPE